MLNERERHTLARIEQHLRESDPEFVRRFGVAVHQPFPAAPVLLALGLLLMVIGTAAVLLPLAVLGMAVAFAALVLAYQRNGTAGFA